MDYKLDPPRGQKARYAVALVTAVEPSADAVLMLDKVELIEPSDVQNAVESFRKLRRLASRLHSTSAQKRTHSLDHLFPHSPQDLKRCKTLTNVPTDASLPDSNK